MMPIPLYFARFLSASVLLEPQIITVLAGLLAEHEAVSNVCSPAEPLVETDFDYQGHLTGLPHVPGLYGPADMDDCRTDWQRRHHKVSVAGGASPSLFAISGLSGQFLYL